MMEANLVEQAKAFSDPARSEKSLKRLAAEALRTLSKMSEVPKTMQTSDTLYILPYCDRDAELLIKAWKQLFPPRPARPLIHNGGKPRRRA